MGVASFLETNPTYLEKAPSYLEEASSYLEEASFQEEASYHEASFQEEAFGKAFTAFVAEEYQEGG